jgi:carbamoyl-phosphate synthase small subunit
MSIPARAVLVLEDGTTFTGHAFGFQGETLGEIVFATGMTGYQETLTDPSYADQIVVQTAPHIGNTGMNSDDEESDQIWVAGYVVRDPSRITSNWRSEQSLDKALESDEIVGISGIDTRALTLHLRDKGAMRAGIFSGESADRAVSDLVATVLSTDSMAGKSLSAKVSTPKSYEVPAVGQKIGNIAILDLGIKRATIENLAKRGLDVHVYPATIDLEGLLSKQPDAVFFSNGPGDPATADAQIKLLQQVLARRIPFFGICFGNQLLGRALGLETYKLAFGHRGINQPVLDYRTGKVEITAHNHGFAVRVDEDKISGVAFESPAGFGKIRVSHVGLNDQVVEGIECLDLPAYSVQYHPEAAAGPHDANYLFDRLIELINTNKEGNN